jgi:hypothetical protein
MAVRARLERLGGVLARPRATLQRLLSADEGSLYEPLSLFALAAIIAAPSQAGRAMLFFRANPIEGLSVLLNLFAERLWPVCAGALGVSVILRLVLLRRRITLRPSFARLVDLGFYFMLPHAPLVALGATLAHFGYDLWFMPHRLPAGGTETMLPRLLVAYLPTLGLLSWSVAGLDHERER